MKVFLTGATGFVGHHVAKALAAEGADLRLLVRKTSNLANFEGIPGETVVGDLSDPDSLKLRACRLRRRRPRCRRLPPLDSRSRRHVPRQRRRHARAAAHGPRSQASSASSTPRASPPCTSAPTASSSTKTRPSRSPTWSATTSAPSSWPSRRPSPPRRAGQQVIILNPTTPIGPNDAQAHAHRPHLRRLPQRQISRLHGHRPQSRRRLRSRPRPRSRAHQGHARPPLHPRRRKPHPQADPRQDVGHHRHPFAHGQNSLRRRRHLRLFRGVDHRPHPRQGAPRHARRGPHGPQEDVRLQRPRPAGAWLPHRARLPRHARRHRLVPRPRLRARERAQARA